MVLLQVLGLVWLYCCSKVKWFETGAVYREHMIQQKELPMQNETAMHDNCFYNNHKFLHLAGWRKRRRDCTAAAFIKFLKRKYWPFVMFALVPLCLSLASGPLYFFIPPPLPPTSSGWPGIDTNLVNYLSQSPAPPCISILWDFFPLSVHYVTWYSVQSSLS